LLFHTLDFAIFFLLIYGVYLRAGKHKQTVLLLGSLFFYGYWNVRVLSLLILTVGINYFCAIRIEETASRQRKVWLLIAVCTNLLLLGIFKYYNFFIDSLGAILRASGFHADLPVLNILLPAGISFYTFELISYVVDVYRGNKAERSLPDLLLFGTFFPKMMAGPIARAAQLIPQLKNPREIDWTQIRHGALLAALGLFKKVVIADNIALSVNRLVGNTHAPASLRINSGPPLDTLSILIAGSLFAVQIYADFSGYSDMARGMSRMLGIELVQNFNRPFLSSNPAEFWRRWHITLGAFLRDYLYVPLGGNRVGAFTQARNVMIVWALGGLWHGASVGYLAWGVYCGALVVLFQIVRPIVSKTGRAGKMIGCVFTFVSFGLGLMIFRLGSPALLFQSLMNWQPAFHLGMGDLLAAFLCVPFLISHSQDTEIESADRLMSLPAPLLWIVLNFMLYIFLLLGRFQGEEFFYFRF